MRIISHTAYAPRTGGLGYTANEESGSIEHFVGVVLLRDGDDYTAGPKRFDRYMGRYTTDYERAKELYREKDRAYRYYTSVPLTPEVTR